MDDLVEMPGKGVARRSSRKVAGLTVINNTLGEAAEPLRIADGCRQQLQRGVELGGFYQYLGGEHGALEAKFLDRAKVIHGRLLRDVAAVDRAHSALLNVVMWLSPPLTHSVATAMLGVLFGALNKKRGDDENAAMLLASCADLFNPVNDLIGGATGLWKPVSKHPLVLAIAIKQLIATSVFTPSPAELRAAMKSASDRIGSLAAYAGQWLDLIEHADALVFAYDREAWGAAYAALDNAVPRAVQRRLFEDDHDEEFPPSPRWLALRELADRPGNVAEEAACTVKPVKRTHKPKPDDA